MKLDIHYLTTLKSKMDLSNVGKFIMGTFALKRIENEHKFQVGKAVTMGGSRGGTGGPDTPEKSQEYRVF